MYRRLAFGDLAQLHVLDTRQYRDDQACAASGGGQVVTCAERTDPRRSILGRRQRRWLLGGLDRSQGRCTIRPDRWHTDVRVVDSIPRRDAGVRTLARFLVEDGRPGSHRVD